jgi:molybdate transport system substrate-binding protein
MRTSRVLRLTAVAVSAMMLAACGSSSTSGTSSSPSSSGASGAATSGAITVFAASSLKEAFTTIGQQFEAADPGAKVTFNFGPSSTLATQITQGAPADVFAAASTKTMDTVVSGGAASGPQTFATNTMQIATPPKPTVPVTSLADLAKPGVKVAVCQKDVPCGVAADKLFTQNNLTVTPVSQEVDVKAVLAKVALGEVDAGVVYVTDVKAAGDKVVGVTIPSDQNVTTKYPIVAIKASAQASTAAAFVAYVLSPAGQQVLAAAGFASA